MSAQPVPPALRRSRAAAPVRAATATLAVLAALAAAGCNNKRVSRIDPASVANALVTQALGGPWLGRAAEQRGGRPPAVIVGRFANQTMEHIPVNTFVRDVERALVGSGTVTVVASADERQSVRAERVDQQQNATADSRTRLAKETGAQYMLQGDVQAIEDAEGREKVVYYQIDATLVDLESNAKVWIGQHKIKKYVDRRRLGW